MNEKKPMPGVSRDDRLSDEGLRRLEKQLESGARMRSPILAQWIKRYGEPARVIIKKHGQYRSELESI